ncbi:tripartite tricarboxylate transporter TctB family protein [Undibacter mobilis]|uniref:Tripartite tricarboxylate transporter TctB family protein n=1 Tax=Undibacter mobilis TaxID=2292256 RepID=A0A371B7R6_9BRAD|nr:tripartite tricarboxylate transporter TctB family protein [Undibacter mobilis]RDV03493.1 tripartite tricarboxylate transporter TctB family protein [Undibacter mobilis]
MSDMMHETGGAGPSHRGVEIGVTIFVALIGLIAVIGSLQVGAGWGSDGPQAGFFPFYIGLSILISSAVNLMHAWNTKGDGKVFATWLQLRQVSSVVVPTTIYVFAIPYIGIYVASIILIAVFMTWLGRYRPQVTLPIAIGMPILVFVIFEKWFLVPLPKGPVEKLLGF